MDRAAQHIKASGVSFDDALLAHLSPMGWAHISLTGDYLWHRAKPLSPANSALSTIPWLASNSWHSQCSHDVRQIVVWRTNLEVTPMTIIRLRM
jgi:hypothetical protein